MEVQLSSEEAGISTQIIWSFKQLEEDAVLNA